MDVQNLREKYPHLLFFMKENGYSVIYIRRVRAEINHIIQGNKWHKWSTYEDVYLTCTRKSKSEASLRGKRSIIGIIKRFDLEGIFPHPSKRTKFLKPNSYALLPKEYKRVIDSYCVVAKQREKRDDTIYTESHNAAIFLLSLHQKGMDAFNKITERAVLEFFFDNGKLYRGCSYKKNISAVFKACVPLFPKNTCTKVLSYLPALRERRKNIQYLTPKEIAQVKAVLTDSKSSISLRDKAIGLIALYMGLRSCDIAGISLSNIDWTNDRLHVSQQKTEVPLILPLGTTIGNAIYDYLIKERPETKSKEVFVSPAHPFTKLQGSSMYNVAKKIMKAANIRMNNGDRQGFHIFRHHMAISLLENGIPQPVISSTMGHTSPTSLNAYLNANFSHLKQCALSIECFPLKKEVLL